MNISRENLKAALLEQIEEADERLLRMLYAVAFVSDQEDGFQPDTDFPVPDWKQISHEALVERLKLSLAQFEAGEFMTIEELEKEMQTW